MTTLGGAVSDDELLDPAEAFKTSALADADQNLQVEIDVADGYFLYRSKIKVSSNSATFGDLQLPNGKKKTDEFFGEVETYRGLLSFSTPIKDINTEGPLSVTVQSQGCADIGVCLSLIHISEPTRPY